MMKTALCASSIVCGAGTRLRADAPAWKAPASTKATVTPEEVKEALSSCGYRAAGAVVVGDLVIDRPIEVCCLTVIGSVRVTAAATLKGVKILSKGTALTVDAAGVTVCDCRLEGQVALESNADSLTLLRSVLIAAERGVDDKAKAGTLIRDCAFSGKGTAISTAACDAQIMYNTLTLEAGDTGIDLGAGTNMIAAMNVVEGARNSIVMVGAKNSVILKNAAATVTVKSCHAAYVIENRLSGALTATDNNYLIADCNEAAETVAAGNENDNGNNLMDVDARLPYGADERLLPHTDKDLFVGMPRKTLVRDPDLKQDLALPRYVSSRAICDSVVIVPPGAYCSDEAWTFDRDASNTTIYCYGVYAERQQDLHRQAGFDGVANITLKGITFAFRQQSCGQVYLVEKLGMAEDGETGTVRVLTGAGMVNEFGASRPGYFGTREMGAQRAGTFYAYCDSQYLYLDEPEEDGTRLMTVSAEVYAYLEKGDILTCRLRNGSTAIPVRNGCENVVFYDLTMFGGAAGFAWVEEENKTATTYYRVVNTTRSSEVVDEATFRRYRALEEKYGVSLEIYQDALGRFRGSPCHIGSIDATHTTSCAQGSIARFCLFECMCDDGTNQHHMHARVGGVTDNKDGTTTILYKASLSVYAHNHGPKERRNQPRNFCIDFLAGDRVYIYNSAGQLVCDTPALTPTKDEGTAIAPEYGTEYRQKSVTVTTDAVNFRALEGYDLTANTPNDRPGDKVMIDNMSKASNGFIFDNTMVRNIRSRGMLIKSSGSKIVNCTFRNIGMSCAAILYEIFWGESGVTERMEVSRNLFDHTGYFQNCDRYAPIAIEGLGSRVDEDYLLYKDIVITDNVIKNRTTDYAVYVNSAKGVVIKNNDFGSVNELGNRFSADIHLNGAMNIEISGNTYSDPSVSGAGAVKAAHVKNIFGTDVVKGGVPQIPDCE